MLGIESSSLDFPGKNCSTFLNPLLRIISAEDERQIVFRDFELKLKNVGKQFAFDV